MTIPDPFSAASVSASATPDPFGAQSAGAPAPDQLTGNNSGYDPLFGGDKLISLFDKTIGVGVQRTGIIDKPPTDKQSRFFKAGGVGALKFWAPAGSDKPVTDRATAPDGTPNRPCMDTVFVLATDYRLTPAEAAERQMDPSDDDGLRGFFASGASLKATRDAIKAAGVSSREQLAGMRMTIMRTGKKPAGDFEAWTWAVKIEKV